ncbi:MAG: LytTR family DNA-binding domain-containing protein [Sedimentitalea sp.]
MSQTKPDFATAPQNTANDTALSLTLRQLHATLRTPLYWIINGSAVFLAALAGPYFTLERLNFAERMVFWGTTVVFSALLMTFLSIFAYRVNTTRDWPWPLVALLAGAVGVLPVVGSLYLAQGLATGFGPGWSDWAPFSSLVLSVAPSLVAVTLMVNLAIRLQNRDAPPGNAAPQTPALSVLQRKLPHHLGHDIVTVRAQDHYVEVTTPKGQAMVLMRLGDAVQDLAPLCGLQVHRSWWINLSHVTRSQPGANGPEVVMSTDQVIPVGRSFRAAFRTAMSGADHSA